MRKKLLHLFLALLIPLLGVTQMPEAKRYAFSLNGNVISVEANFAKMKTALRAEKRTEDKNASNYFIIQFFSIPGEKEKKELAEQGIRLLNYIAGNAYFASIKNSFYYQSKATPNIRALINIEPKYKVDQDITSGRIPEHALVNENVAQVIITYFDGVQADFVNKELSRYTQRISNHFARTRHVTMAISISRIMELAGEPWVQSIELIPPPSDFDNRPGRTLSRTNVMNSLIPGLGYGLTGKGINVGVWDGNIQKHKDFGDRVVNREYESSSSHGNHVAGTIGGSGLLDPRARGMAPDVKIFGWNFNTQSNGLLVWQERLWAAENDNIDLTSNSYGINVTACYNVNRYSINDWGDDYTVLEYPHLLTVYSNGNNQSVCPDGFHTSSKSSKNALHVAALNEDETMSNFSSFGPTIDGRLVPQISAVGVNVWSVSYNNGYETMSGTSMSTPTVSGAIALLIERYKNIYNGDRPRASLMKAIVCNTARDLGNPGPDYKFGFGNFNAVRAINVIDKKQFYLGNATQGSSNTFEIDVPANVKVLKVTLAWSDYPGTVGTAKILVNDLDLRVVKDGITTLPWVLNPASPNSNATRGVEKLNNIEQITIDNPVAGKYTIVVNGTSVPMGPQEFAVTYDFVTPVFRLDYPIGGENLNPGTTEYIRWESEGYTGNISLEYSTDGGVTYNLIADGISASLRSYAWTVPDVITKDAKIRISNGTQVASSKANFTIMKVPSGLAILGSTACGNDVFTLNWNAIAGAKYEVLKLNGFQWEKFADATTNSYTITGLAPGDDNFFSVVAIDIATEIRSERAPAVFVNPTVAPVAFPIKEDFNENKTKNFTLSNGLNGSLASITYANLTNLYVVRMQGTTASSGWVASTAATAFTNNPNHIKSVNACQIDATSMAGKKLRMKLDFANVGASNKSFFRVLLNGTPIASHEAITTYASTSTSFTGLRTIYYDLSSVAGTTFNLSIQAVNDVSTEYVLVDNIEIYEATDIDLELTALTPNTGLTSAENVTIKVYNWSPNPVSDIPVSYQINGGAEVEEVIPGPLNSFAEVTYTFTQKANYSSPGLYSVVAKVNLPGDVKTSNNSLTRTVINNGTDIPMVTGPVTYTNCNATLVDNGGRFGNYSDNLAQTVTFAPSLPDHNIRVEVVEYDIETDWDFLNIHDGANTSAPRIARLTGTGSNKIYTSTADGGQLTFNFTSDAIINKSGFIANITCVPKPANDAGITAITAPAIVQSIKTAAENITISIKNFGKSALTNLPVFYQINGGTKVTETISSIAPLATVNYTFTEKANMLAIGKYTITAGIDLSDDNNDNNTLTRDVYCSNPLPTHTNTDGYGITKLTWGNVVNSSGVSAYSDFRSIEIPVYTGLRYQPQVEVSIPERPITRDMNTTTTGIFTFIVIDLNGNGDLGDEFNAGTFWVNSLHTAPTNGFLSTKTTHNFRNYLTLDGGLIIPSGTSPGKKLMRIVHTYRDALENYNVYLGPTKDGIVTSRFDFEVEEYTIDVKPYAANDAGIASILTPTRPGLKTVTVSALVRNYQPTALTSVTAAYRVNGGPEVEQTFAVSIASGATGTITFTTKADISAAGSHTIEVYTKIAGDPDPTNDRQTITIETPSVKAGNFVGYFDGIDDAVIGGNTTPYNMNSTFTIEAWINPTRIVPLSRIVDKSTVLFFVSVDNINYPQNCLVFQLTNATTYRVNTGANTIKTNTWQHVAAVVSSGTIQAIYIDGVPTPLLGATGTPGAANSNLTTPLHIGNSPAMNRPFNGFIDEVRIWSTARTQAQIQNDMYTQFVGNEAGLLAYYRFIEGEKQFVYDFSNNDNTALIVNADLGTGAGKFWNKPVLLKSFGIEGETVPAKYDEQTNTITAFVPTGTNLTNLKANFTTNFGSAVTVAGVPQVSGVTENDFTVPVTYTFTGTGFNTGVSESVIVSVQHDPGSESNLLSYEFKKADNPGLTSDIMLTVAGNNAYAKVPFGTNVSNLKAQFTVSAGAELQIGGVVQTSPQTNAMDYSQPIIARVVSGNKAASKLYSVFIDARNTLADITSFTVTGQVGTTQIDQENKTIKAFVTNTTPLNSLIATFTASPNATVRVNRFVQTSGLTANNFANPVVYEVESEDGATFNYWTVTVEQDLVKPVITLLGDSPITIAHGSTYKDAGATAVDNVDGDLTASIVVTNPVNTNLIGQYTVRYNVTDAAGNAADEVTRTVNVTDQTKPVITLLGNAVVNINVGETYIDAGATAFDNVDGDLTASIVVTNPVNTNVIGQYTVRYNVTDAAGNAADEVTRTVNVMPKLVTSIVVKGAGGVSAINVNGGTLQMIAEVYPADATNKTVTWSVINRTGSATISTSGLLQAVSNGVVTVVATANDGSNVQGSLDVTISNQSTSVNIDANTIVSIYPNPAINVLNISTSGQWSKLIIHNAIGVQMKSLPFAESIDISDLKPGLYFITIFDANGLQLSTARFIKQ